MDENLVGKDIKSEKVKILKYILKPQFSALPIGHLDQYKYDFKTSDGKILRYAGRRYLGTEGEFVTFDYHIKRYTVTEKERYFTIRITKVFSRQ